MKLYTEEQVRNGLTTKNNILPIDLFLEQMTPIELPSDEEIRKESMEFYDNNGADFYFIQGAKWVIEQIKNQDNGTPVDKKGRVKLSILF